jgi:uncharacterized membrane protein
VTITITVLPQESPSATYPRGFAYGVSADGSIAVGSYNDGSVDFPAYYSDGTITALPLLSGDTSGAALACSDDGSIVVGYSLLATEDAFTQTAVYWESGSIHALDPASNDTGETAVCCSSDGTVIVGIGPSGHPYYWTSGVPTELTATLPGGSTIYPSGCSADGSTIVGSASDAGGARAAVWNSGTLTALPSNPDGVESDVAYGCSSDGSSIVVGVVSDIDFNTIPCVWISGTLTFLDMGGAAAGAAAGCSADGTVIGGWVYDGSFNQVACAWINGALLLLPEIPSAARIDNKAAAVSDDGSTLVGRSVDADGNTRAVYWSLPTTADTATLSLTADDAAIASTATNAIAADLSLTAAAATLAATATSAIAADLSLTAADAAIASAATNAATTVPEPLISMTTWTEAEAALRAFITDEWAGTGRADAMPLAFENETAEYNGSFLAINIDGIWAEKTIFGSSGKRSSVQAGIVFLHAFVPTGSGKASALDAIQAMTVLLELQTIADRIYLEGGAPPSPVAYGDTDREITSSQPGGNFYRCSGSVPFIVVGAL